MLTEIISHDILEADIFQAQGEGKLKNRLCHFIVILFISIFSFFLCVTPLFADDNQKFLDTGYGAQEPTEQKKPADPVVLKEPVANVNTWDFVNMILGLLVVVGIIYLIFYLLKRGMGKKIVENEMIRVLGSRVITGSKALHLVEVGGAIYLVGSSNDSLNLIAEVKEKEAQDTIRLAAANTAQKKPMRFTDIISSIFKPGAKKQLEINEGIDFLKRQRNRLKKMKE